MAFGRGPDGMRQDKAILSSHGRLGFQEMQVTRVPVDAVGETDASAASAACTGAGPIAKAKRKRGGPRRTEGHSSARNRNSLPPQAPRVLVGVLGRRE